MYTVTINLQDFCHSYDSNDVEDCITYFQNHLENSLINPPSFFHQSPHQPPSLPTVYLHHTNDFVHYANYIIMSTIIILLCIALTYALLKKTNFNQCCRRQQNQSNENNEIPMVTIVISPDQTTSIAST